jgi:DNA-binding GntR family transcriptional regulator
MKAENKPIRQIIYSQLVEDIVRGRINAGEKLLESELAINFHCSRTPAREALFQLEKDGYISHKKNVGAIVKKISWKNVQEIFDVLAQLERYAAENFVTNKIETKEFLHLETLQEKMENSTKKKNYIEYQIINIQFHNFIVKKCQNQTLIDLVSDLRNKVYRLVKEGLSLPMNIDHYLASHRNILNAISEKNALKAGNLMKAHVEESAKYLLNEMRDRD